MALFTSKELNSQEYETILKRIAELNSRVVQLELEQDDFRNKVLRKIQKKEEEKSKKYLVPLPTTRQ